MAVGNFLAGDFAGLAENETVLFFELGWDHQFFSQVMLKTDRGPELPDKISIDFLIAEPPFEETAFVSVETTTVIFELVKRDRHFEIRVGQEGFYDFGGRYFCWLWVYS